MLTTKIKIGLADISNGHVNIPLSSNFSTETQQHESLGVNFKLNNEDIINPIIDLEKIKLHPIGVSELAKSLTFRLHFINENDWDLDSTNITSIGFTDDDVLNKRMRLQKTFIRLSFYDDKDLKKQNLLYYSTIYIDSDDLYSRYIQDGHSSNLRLNFFVQNPRLTTKTKSFEGFNLYLFKGDVPKNNVRDIYMRVDFNNAVNGRVSLFTANKPNSLDGYELSELYDNLFCKVNCYYDNNKRKYVYKFNNKDVEANEIIEDKNIDNTIIIDLYQAKIK